MRLSVHHKLALTFSLLVALVLAGVYSHLATRLRERTYERIAESLTANLALARTVLEEAGTPPADPVPYYDRLADKIGVDLGIRATVIGPDGTVWGDTDLTEDQVRAVENHLYRPEVQEAFSRRIGQSTRFSTTIQETMLYMARTFGDSPPYPVIRLALPLFSLHKALQRLRTIILMSMAGAFVLVVLLSYAASLLITRPLQELVWCAREVAWGNYSRRSSLSSNDEIGDLARTFNYMAEQISRRIEEVTSNKVRLETVLLSMFDGVMVMDATGIILLMNKTLKDFLAVDADPVGKKPLEVIRNVEVQEIADSVLKGLTGVKSKEITLLYPEEKILLVHATAVIREETIEGAVLVFHDITDLRKLERIRKDFVANVSHELRTPVSSIKGYAETLLEGGLDDTQNARDFLDIIHSNADRLAVLVNDLLDLSRIESGMSTMSFEPCALCPMVERVIKIFRKKAREKNITIQNTIPPEFPPVRADRSSLAQVFLNLIDNAVKYNVPGGTVTVSAESDTECVHVRVTDTGVGIPEGDIPRIFERFYRVDKARSRELGGTGLGLSIVKHIMQSHGGNVSVESAVNGGSVFHFTLPHA